MELPKRFSRDWWADHSLMFGAILVVAAEAALCAVPIFV
jgi:hypothetical protein